MKLSVVASRVAFTATILAVATGAASAQQLSELQTTGRQIFAQSCGVCHLPPVMNARTYGPTLSKETGGGNAEILRAIISEGGPRMPAFKHYLERPQMDAIIAYLSTIAPPPPVQLRAAAQLNEQQTTGRQVFQQSCGVCHLPPVLGARTYGPQLSKDTGNGNPDIIRAIISEGGPRMPAFKHYLERSQMDAVIAYLATVGPAPAGAAR
jgi:mono/diheme cytochrome c family protein